MPGASPSALPPCMVLLSQLQSLHSNPLPHPHLRTNSQPYSNIISNWKGAKPSQVVFKGMDGSNNKKWSFATCLVRHSTIKLLGQSSWSVESQLRLLKNTSSASGPGCDAAQPLEESTFQGLRGKHNWSCPSICFFHVFLWQTCLDLLVGKRFNNPATKTIGFAISNLNMAQTHTSFSWAGYLGK